MAYLIRQKKTQFVLLLLLAITLLVYTFYRSPLRRPDPALNARIFVHQTRSEIVQLSPDGDSQSLHNFNSTPSNSSMQRKISVELVGAARLGNLMFGHASMLGMADRNKLDPIVSSKNVLLFDSFHLGTESRTSHATDWWMCQEKFACAFDDTLDDKISHSNQSVLLFGYFQSWRYFDHIRERIVKEFRFRSSFSEKAAKFLETVTQKNYPSSAVNRTLNQNILRIGIHVRRGDMLASTSVKKGMTVASAEYLKRAIAYLEERLSNSTTILPLSLLYIVVSDDIGWCRKNIVSPKYPIEFGTGYDQASIDLAVLASCNHTIMTVGTFSWWAAYLSGGITVYYKDFPAPGTETAAIFRAEDYFLPTWIGLS